MLACLTACDKKKQATETADNSEKNEIVSQTAEPVETDETQNDDNSDLSAEASDTAAPSTQKTTAVLADKTSSDTTEESEIQNNELPLLEAIKPSIDASDKETSAETQTSVTTEKPVINPVGTTTVTTALTETTTTTTSASCTETPVISTEQTTTEVKSDKPIELPFVPIN